MLVRAKELCFVEGSRRKPGAVFEYKGKLTDLLEVVEGEVEALTVEPKEVVEPTKKELMRDLDAAGVKYKITDSKETLSSLLKEVRAKFAAVVA